MADSRKLAVGFARYSLSGRQRRGVTTTLANYVTAYAATHPQEDFAETFRFYVTRRGRLRELFAELGRKRRGVPVFERFLVLGDYIRSLGEWT